MKITGNEPANPITNSDGFPSFTNLINKDGNESIGLTIRQRFAMAAMQGLCAVNDKGEYVSMEDSVAVCAYQAVLYADALINELNKSEK